MISIIRINSHKFNLLKNNLNQHAEREYHTTKTPAAIPPLRLGELVSGLHCRNQTTPNYLLRKQADDAEKMFY